MPRCRTPQTAPGPEGWANGAGGGGGISLDKCSPGTGTQPKRCLPKQWFPRRCPAGRYRGKWLDLESHSPAAVASGANIRQKSGLAVDTSSPVQTPAVATADAARDRDRPVETYERLRSGSNHETHEMVQPDTNLSELAVSGYPRNEVAHVKAEPVETHDLLDTAASSASAAAEPARPATPSGAGASAKGVKDVVPVVLRKRPSDNPEPSASAPPPSKKLRDIAENIYPFLRHLNSEQLIHVTLLVTQRQNSDKPAPDRLFDASKALKILKESVTYLPRPARVLERPLDSAPSEVLEDISTALVVRLEKVDEALFSITGWKIKPNDPEEEVDMTQGGSRPSPAGLEGPDDPFNDQIPLRSRPPTIVEVAKFTTVFEYYFDEDVYQLLPGGRRLRDLSKMSRQEDASVRLRSLEAFFYLRDLAAKFTTLCLFLKFCVKVVSGSGSGTAEKDEKARRVFARTRALQSVADRLGCILDTSQCTVMYEGMKDVAGPVRPLIESLLESWGEISIIKFIMGDQWSPPEIIT